MHGIVQSSETRSRHVWTTGRTAEVDGELGWRPANLPRCDTLLNHSCLTRLTCGRDSMPSPVLVREAGLCVFIQQAVALSSCLTSFLVCDDYRPEIATESGLPVSYGIGQLSHESCLCETSSALACAREGERAMRFHPARCGSPAASLPFSRAMTLCSFRFRENFSRSSWCVACIGLCRASQPAA